MTKISDEEILAAAKEAQYRVIQGWIRNKYFDGTSMLVPYSDHYYAISLFGARTVKVGLGIDTTRRRLKKLAESGKLRMRKGRSDRAPVCFGFDRETCDELAARATQHWESLGLSLNERRHLNKQGGEHEQG